MRSISVAAAVLLSLCAAGAHAQATSTRAIWNDPNGSGWQCQNYTCLDAVMRRTGASTEAIQMAYRLQGVRGNSPAWLSQIYRFGPMDVLVYDCANCRMGGFAVVHGPSSVFADTFMLETADNAMRGDRAFMARHPNALFTRYGERFVGVRPLTGGGRQFLFVNAIADCEACRPFGAIEFFLNFDGRGDPHERGVLSFVPASMAEHGVSPPGH